jgi:tetratricopeptide (TPR) repeat protein
VILQGAAKAANDALKPGRQVDYLREAAQILDDLGDVDERMVVWGLLATALGDDDRLDELRGLVEQMRLHIDATTDVLAHAEFDHAVSYVQYFDGDLDACLVSLDRALAGYDKTGALDRHREALGQRSGLLMSLGRFREANVLRRGILAIATEENDLRTAAQALVGVAVDAEEWTEALSHSLEAAAIARRGGCGGPELISLANAVEFAVETGAWATADELLLDLQSRPDLPAFLAEAVAFDAALLAAYRGEHATALAALDGVRTLMEASPNPTAVAWYRRVRSVLLLTSGDLTGAFDEAIAAIDREAGIGTNSTVAAVSAGHAALWLRDPERARRAVERMPLEDKRWHVACRRALEAGVDALEGRTGEAAAVYDSVLAGRLAAGDPFTHALITLDAAAVLPEDLVPEGALASTHAYLEGLGAHALLARLSAVGVRT